MGQPEPDRPSTTSVWVAAARAFGAREPDPTVRNPDWLAERLLGPEGLALLGDHPLAAALAQPYEATAYEEASKSLEIAGLARMLIIRTRFIDERLEAAIADGATQVVILGAGFDTRAYRFAELLKSARVFEVDRPATQNLKIRRVREAIGAPPANLTYTPFDFRHEPLGEALARAGFKAGEKTFFIWEGVTMYLPAAAVHDTLRWIGSVAAPGSAVVFDYAGESAIKFFAKFESNVDIGALPDAVKIAIERFRRMIAAEPWIFGLPDDGEKEFLAEFALHLRSTMSMTGSEAVAKYLTRADGTVFGGLPANDQRGYSILEAAR
jgi:methyltransferase (TIGR00027 family)